MTQDKDRTPVAQDITTLCTKCKMELNHTVIAHTEDGIVARVQCRTCGSEHKYHPEKKKASRKAASATGKTPRQKAAGRKTSTVPDLAKLLEKVKDKTTVPYSMSGTFRVNDVIDHATFGVGLVMKTSRQRINVLFSDALRTLVCGGE